MFDEKLCNIFPSMPLAQAEQMLNDTLSENMSFAFAVTSNVNILSCRQGKNEKKNVSKCKTHVQGVKSN